MGQEREPQAGGSWLERKLAALEALYRKFGREGLKDHPLADVGLLLSAKELQLRDAAKSRDLGEDQKVANRQLELEIKDLTAYAKGQLSLRDLRHGSQEQEKRGEDQRSKSREMER